MEYELKITITIPEYELKTWHQYDEMNRLESYNQMKIEAKEDIIQSLKKEGLIDFNIESKIIQVL